MAKSKLSKKTIYFLLSVILFGIIPLTVKNLSGKKPEGFIKPEMVQELGIKAVQKIAEIRNIPTTKPTNNKDELMYEAAALRRDPFLIARRISEYDFYKRSNEQGVNPEGQNSETKAENPLEGFELKAVLIDGEKKYALINDKLCFENGDVNGMKVVFIREGEVGLLNNGTISILHIKE